MLLLSSKGLRNGEILRSIKTTSFLANRCVLWNFSEIHRKPFQQFSFDNERMNSRKGRYESFAEGFSKEEDDYRSILIFQILQKIFYNNFNKQRELIKPDLPTALQKEMALRSTLSQRVFGEIDITFNAELEKFIRSWDKSKKELVEHLEERFMVNRLTMHPTEGRTISAIKYQYYLENAAFLFMKAAKLNRSHFPNAYDSIELREMAKSTGMDMSKFKDFQTTGSWMDFQETFESFVEHIMHQFLITPLGHPKKMSKNEEIEMLLFWGTELRRKKAHIMYHINKQNENQSILNDKFLEDTTWAGDRDGKEEIDSLHYCNFELESQRSFFKELKTRLRYIRDILEYHNKHRNNIEELLKYLKKLCNLEKVEYKILTSEEVLVHEKKILDMLKDLVVSGDRDLGREYMILMYFLEGSGLKVFKNGFTSREEPMKISKSLENLAIIYFAKEVNFDKEIGGFINLVTDNSGKLEEIVNKIAENLHNSPELLKKENMKHITCNIASRRFHSKHEHIISCFDCKVNTYLETIALDKISLEIAKQHTKFSFLKDEFGLFYNTVFSEGGVKDITSCKFLISTLPENHKDVKELTNFYEQAIKIPAVYQHLKAVGQINITISKSDGSESMGAYLEPFYSTNNVIKLEKLAKDNGLKLSTLYGVGANDAERLAYHDFESIRPQQTIQGGNIPNFVNYKRIVRSLMRKRPDINKEMLEQFLNVSGNYEFLDKFTSHMHKIHKRCYFGIYTNYDGVQIYSGRTLYRGPITMDIQSIMGRASARGETRTGEKSAPDTQSNTPRDFKDLDRKLRRIGEVNTNRIVGLTPFLFENFIDDIFLTFSSEEEKKKIKELHRIPMFRDILFNALQGVALSDPEVALIHNGFHGKDSLEKDIVIHGAMCFMELYNAQAKNKSLIDFENLDPAELRFLHLCYLLYKLKGVIKNAFHVILIDANEDTKRYVEHICDDIEKIPVLRTWDLLNRVSDACLVAAEDKEIDSDMVMRLSVMAKNLRFKEVAVKLRKFYTIQANEHIVKDKPKYKKFIEYYAVLIRGSGNPFGKGGNHDRDLKEYYNRYKDPVDRRVVSSLILKNESDTKNPFLYENHSSDAVSLYRKVLNDSLKNLFNVYEQNKNK